MILPICAALATSVLVVSATVAEYDYVIVGSGPGGGSLALVYVTIQLKIIAYVFQGQFGRRRKICLPDRSWRGQLNFLLPAHSATVSLYDNDMNPLLI